ncbi:hypothetical protein PGTUg99_004509 [Puccinia graminis f. sp. tritici]|uniref:Uncharacterized protein n=1 Tax=Puccinia graminis f. sp. tritici TaxID=56615 RepID=A0A5B0Q0F6_PUCGR|nr:hypothetical protein PGTUg99_004509 [Puccinia graminis f. sp. tritici]
MKTLLRISDKKINLEGNPLFSKQLIQRLQIILETNLRSCVHKTRTLDIKIIIQFVKDVTKTAHLLIIIYLSLFKQHRDEVFTLKDSENILEFINETWWGIYEDSPEFNNKDWAKKVSKLFKFQWFQGTNYYIFTERRCLQTFSHNLLIHWKERTGKFSDCSRGYQKTENDMLVGLINMMVFHSNHETIMNNVSKKRTREN